MIGYLFAMKDACEGESLVKQTFYSFLGLVLVISAYTLFHILMQRDEMRRDTVTGMNRVAAVANDLGLEEGDHV
jgi:hypothetical protein